MPTVTLKSGRQLEVDVECEEASGDGFNEPRHRASVGVVAVWENGVAAMTTPDEDQEIMALIDELARESEYDDRDD